MLAKGAQPTEIGGTIKSALPNFCRARASSMVAPPICSRELRDDLACKPPDPIVTVGDVWLVDDDVIDSGRDVLFESLGELFNRSDEETLLELLAGHAALNLDLARIFAIEQQARVYFGRFRDRIVIAANLFAVLLKDFELRGNGFGTAWSEIRCVGPLRDELERHFWSTATDPKRNMRLLDALRFIDRLVNVIVLAVELGVVLVPHLVDNF